LAQRMIEFPPHQRARACHVRMDITNIVRLRNRMKSTFEQRHGARLTFMPFFVRAAIIGLQQFPIVNASIEGENIHYTVTSTWDRRALDWGLIVPVLKNADELNFLGLQRGITDLGERARNKKLKPEEVEGSTFTVTNPGQFGAVFGLPIINQPNFSHHGCRRNRQDSSRRDRRRWQRFHRHPFVCISPSATTIAYRRRRPPINSWRW